MEELEHENDFNVIVASTLLYKIFQDHTESGLLPGIEADKSNTSKPRVKLILYI